MLSAGDFRNGVTFEWDGKVMSFSDIVTYPFAMLLLWLYNITVNYGAAIILFAIVLKFIFLPFQAKSKFSMPLTPKQFVAASPAMLVKTSLVMLIIPRSFSILTITQAPFLIEMPYRKPARAARAHVPTLNVLLLYPYRRQSTRTFFRKTGSFHTFHTSLLLVKPKKNVKKTVADCNFP